MMTFGEPGSDGIGFSVTNGEEHRENEPKCWLGWAKA